MGKVHRGGWGRSSAVAWLGAVALLATSTARGQEAGPSRSIPARGLSAFVEFRGVGGEGVGDAWSKTAAAKILGETGLGAMFRDVAGQVAANAAEKVPGFPLDLDRGRALVGRIVDRGFALGVHREEGRTRAILVLPGLGVDHREAVETLLNAVAPAGNPDPPADPEMRVVRAPGRVAWGWRLEGDDLLVAFGEPERAMTEALDARGGRAESVESSESRKDLLAPEGDFRPVLVGFADAAALLPPTPPALGLAGLKRVEYRWGFEREALKSVTRVVAPAPRKGLLALLDQPGFAPDAAPVPRGVGEYVVTSVELDKALDLALGLVRELNPEAAPRVAEVLARLDRIFGVALREDLLAHLGPTAAAFAFPETIRAPLTPFGGLSSWLFHAPKVAIVAEVEGRDAFARTLDTLMARINEILKEQAARNPWGAAPEFRKVEGTADTYALDVPPELLPLPAGIRPTVRLGKAHLVLASSPEAAERALHIEVQPIKAEPPDVPFRDRLPKRVTLLSATDPRVGTPELLVNIPFLLNAYGRMARGPRGGPLGGVLGVKVDPGRIPSVEGIRERMGPGMLAASVDDRGLELVTIETFPSPTAVTASPVAAALLLPAVISARAARERMQSINNMKQIALAMHNFHSTNDAFPAAASLDDNNVPLLSWRVALLPYLGENELYNEFHFDEPWDSEHNLKLLERMPAVYRASKGDAKPGHTFYQAFVGNGAGFEEGEMLSLREYTDGTSNTIMAVEAAEAVPWTKPADLPFDPELDLPKLGGLGFPGGFNAAFMDGSVRFLRDTIKPQVLKALITRAGGEVIAADDF